MQQVAKKEVMRNSDQAHFKIIRLPLNAILEDNSVRFFRVGEETKFVMIEALRLKLHH